jgi:hypothetical protein
VDFSRKEVEISVLAEFRVREAAYFSYYFATGDIIFNFMHQPNSHGAKTHLQEACHDIFSSSGFLHESVSSGPLSSQLGPF